MSKFYKIFSLLMVACLATVGAWAQTPVKTVEDLENGAAYSIKSDGRGYLIYDASKDASRAWCSDNTKNGTAIAFMMAVVGLSLPEATLLKKVMTWRLILIFFSTVTLFIIFSGYLFNALM